MAPRSKDARAAGSGSLVYTLLALAVLAISVVPVGAAVFFLGFIRGDSPCVMCWEQRTGMALIALVGLFVLRYGARPRYVGLSVLVGAWGMFMAMRHTGMHAARDVGQGFSVEILGAHTYTWALFIFWISIVMMGVLLMMLKQERAEDGPRELRLLERFTMVVFLVVIVGNMVQAFASTGPPPFMGQGDPIRFSFNPRHWVWSTEEWSYAPVSLRGRWSIEKPEVPSASGDPAAGPLAKLPLRAVSRTRKLALGLHGSPTGLAYDSSGDRFLLTTEQGVYILDSSFGRILRYTVVDPGYSVDMGRLAGGAFIGADTLIAVGENKSYVILREDDHADPDRNFRFFLESFDKFDEVRRSRFSTVRARMMYTLSLAFDPEGDSIYTVSVPNSKVKGLVVSRFEGRDLTLSEEFTPAVAPGSGLQFASGKRSLDELYVTGATVDQGSLLLLSARFDTLLVVDLHTHEIVGACTIPGLVRPVGLAVRGPDLYVAGQDGSITVLRWPGTGEEAGSSGG